MSIEIPIILADEICKPVYHSEKASGADLIAYIDDAVTLGPFERVLVPTGVNMALPAGYEAQIRPRSGLAAKHGITVLNAPGTIDEDYRGEIKVILINLSNEQYTVHRGDRIAQMVITPTVKAAFNISDKIQDSERGSGGFGSTGR